MASGSDDSSQGADAAVVLGAAQYNGEPSPVLAARLDRAYDLYEQGLVQMVVTTGSNQPGDLFTQGKAGYDYLREKGVPDEHLIVIVDGSSTYEELAATARQASRFGIETVVLVSDSYHTFRLRQISDEVGLEATVAPTSGKAGFSHLMRETVAAGLGRIFGYRRLDAR
jgi:vancomycin permeability regulator SanA